MNPFTHKMNASKTVLNSWSNPVGADALLEIGMAIISADLLLDEHFCRHSCVRNFFTSLCIVLFSTSCQDKHCQMLHEQQQTISVWSNVREWMHVLLMNTAYLHLCNFCVIGMNINLATWVTLTWVSQGGWENLVLGGGPASDYTFIP
jgi:hypothetical protein